MAPQLRPYQQEAIAFLAGAPGALYAADPGLGKTAASLAAARAIGARRVLVLAPAVALVSWRAEARRWAPNVPFNLVRSLSDFPTAREGVSVMSYGLIQSHAKVLPEVTRGARPFDVLVLDEAHFLKDPNAKRTAAIYGKACNPEAGNALVSLAKRVWCLTGTPAPNHYGEVYPHLRALAPGRILGVNGKPFTYWQFVDRVCETRPTPFGSGRTIVGSKNGRWLKERMAGFMLRHRKEDVAKDLPPMSWVSVPLAVSRKGAALPAGLTLDEDVLRFIATDPSWPSERRQVGAAKARPAASWIGNMLDAGTAKVVVFALHHEVLDALQAELRAYGVARVDGTTSLAAREAAVSAFQQDTGPRVFLGQTLAAGTALTLTAASDVVMVEMHPTPGHNAQAAQRTHRLGQTNPVTVHVLHADGTSDERVSDILRRKSADLSVVFD